MRKNILSLAFLVALIALLGMGTAAASTFIKCEVQNASNQWATGYNFVMLTDGNVDSAFLEGNQMSKPAGIGTKKVNWNLSENPVPPQGKLEFRTEFTPARYWDVYFVDYFTYKSGAVEKSAFPYAAFFISYTETDDPNSLMATLTVVNNIAATYGVTSAEIAEANGIPQKLVNDDQRQSIHFKDIDVVVNNNMANYSLESFDNPTGVRLSLPDSFTLSPGEVRNFNLGKVESGSYVYTRSTISYVGSDKQFPVECAHAPDPLLAGKVVASAQD